MISTILPQEIKYISNQRLFVGLNKYAFVGDLESDFIFRKKRSPQVRYMSPALSNIPNTQCISKESVLIDNMKLSWNDIINDQYHKYKEKLLWILHSDGYWTERDYTNYKSLQCGKYNDISLIDAITSLYGIKNQHTVFTIIKPLFNSVFEKKSTFSEKMKNKIIKNAACCQLCKKCTNIGECAHIVACGNKGPRNKQELIESHMILSDYDVSDENNGLYLCPNCHTLIDKYPSKYTFNVLMSLKNGITI